jgi:pimeloyl-ACP methyl ester carboxylesterase
MSAEVVLVPGRWMPGAALIFLSRMLARRGYAPRTFSHRGRGPFEANVERLAQFARSRPGGAPAHYVGHSFGGVLNLAMLSRHTDIPAQSVVLLGSPVRGCCAGRRFGEGRFGRWMMGASRSLWDERTAAGTRPERLGVIAGTVPLGLGRTLGGHAGDNDGVVCVAETEVEGMAARALVPAGHSALIVSPKVAGMVARFFSEARFE